MSNRKRIGRPGPLSTRPGPVHLPPGAGMDLLFPGWREPFKPLAGTKALTPTLLAVMRHEHLIETE